MQKHKKSAKFYLHTDTRKTVWANMVAFIRSLGESSLVITIEQLKPRKSTQQRAYAHFLIDCIAEFVGVNPDYLKKEIKVNLGLIETEVISGKVITTVTSTESLSKDEYSVFVTEIVNIAQSLSDSNTGFVIPDRKFFGYDY